MTPLLKKINFWQKRYNNYKHKDMDLETIFMNCEKSFKKEDLNNAEKHMAIYAYSTNEKMVEKYLRVLIESKFWIAETTPLQSLFYIPNKTNKYVLELVITKYPQLTKYYFEDGYNLIQKILFAMDISDAEVKKYLRLLITHSGSSIESLLKSPVLDNDLRTVDISLMTCRINLFKEWVRFFNCWQLYPPTEKGFYRRVNLTGSFGPGGFTMPQIIAYRNWPPKSYKEIVVIGRYAQSTEIVCRLLNVIRNYDNINISSHIIRHVLQNSPTEIPYYYSVPLIDNSLRLIIKETREGLNYHNILTKYASTYKYVRIFNTTFLKLIRRYRKKINFKIKHDERERAARIIQKYWRGSRNGENSCGICQEEFITSKIIIKCKHSFHHHCLKKWQNADHHTCPICREKFWSYNHCRKFRRLF